MAPKKPEYFGAPAKTADQDHAKLLKTSQRVAANMVKYSCCDEPVETDPDALGADPCNRAGAIPNIAVCRENIGRSITNDGYDKHKPLVGIAKDYSKCDPKKLEALLGHNRGMSDGDSRWPPMFGDVMRKGTLASTHLNITLRLYKHGVASPTGESFSVRDDAALQRVCERGHKWWLLSCDISDQDAIEISEWRNSDNNCNQVKHEIEHIKGLQRVAMREIELAGSGGVISLTNVLAKFTAQAQMKVAQTAMLDLARFVVDLRAGTYIDELCNFHSQNVNPNELTVPPSLFATTTKTIKRECPRLKVAIMIEAYTTEEVVSKVRQQFRFDPVLNIML
jgi:hypothetical protein